MRVSLQGQLLGSRTNYLKTAICLNRGKVRIEANHVGDFILTWSQENKELRVVKKFSCLLLLITSGVFAGPILADEPAEAFLEALRERGYYDVAIDYLDGLDRERSGIGRIPQDSAI